MGNIDLAAILVDAAKIREESFNQALADEMRSSNQYPDYARCYCKDLHTATEEAAAKVDSTLARPVFLMLFYAWNDSLDWANEILGNKNG